jgi:hypothetical protein
MMIRARATAERLAEAASVKASEAKAAAITRAANVDTERFAERATVRRPPCVCDVGGASKPGVLRRAGPTGCAYERLRGSFQGTPRVRLPRRTP